jgi:REP element-mobilizing transposase RayT
LHPSEIFTNQGLAIGAFFSYPHFKMLRASPQLEFRLARHGGARAGAGRKTGPRVSHHPRPGFRKLPVHTTLRVRGDVGHLRRSDLFSAVGGAIGASCLREHFRVVHFSVMGNHLHLVVEADDQRALARGMQGLGVRLARAVNRVQKRRGPVFADHYHAHLLRTPTEVARAVAYVLGNYLHHFPVAAVDEHWRDPCSSDVRFDLVARPRTWLLSVGWKRARPR